MFNLVIALWHHAFYAELDIVSCQCQLGRLFCHRLCDIQAWYRTGQIVIFVIAQMAVWWSSSILDDIEGKTNFRFLSSFHLRHFVNNKWYQLSMLQGSCMLCKGHPVRNSLHQAWLEFSPFHAQSARLWADTNIIFGRQMLQHCTYFQLGSYHYRSCCIQCDSSCGYSLTFSGR
jgi:hypothetical protein